MTDRIRVFVSMAVAALLPVLAACDRDRPEPAGGTGPALSGVRYLAGDDDSAGYSRATTPRPFVFPADHDAHPGFRTEWWYFTGNLNGADDNHYGFELTVFRLALEPEPEARESRLAADTVWMGHLTVTDTRRQRFQVAERLSRGAPGLAGATRSGDAVTVRVEDFTIGFDGDAVTLDAGDADFGLELELTGLGRIVAQGDRGLDPKGPEPGNASYYFSAPRLEVRGLIRSAGAAPVAVDGTAWMDREWSTSALSADVEGWDWFALQLDDGRDLMFYRLRGRDGSTSRFSGGSITDSQGRVARLEADDVELAPTRRWTSPATGVRYPVAWNLTVPSLDLELRVAPRLDAQELDVSVRYWEGAVTVAGRDAGRPIEGVGYLELAGY